MENKLTETETTTLDQDDAVAKLLAAKVVEVIAAKGVSTYVAIQTGFLVALHLVAMARVQLAAKVGGDVAVIKDFDALIIDDLDRLRAVFKSMRTDPKGIELFHAAVKEFDAAQKINALLQATRAKPIQA